MEASFNSSFGADADFFSVVDKLETEFLQNEGRTRVELRDSGLTACTRNSLQPVGCHEPAGCASGRRQPSDETLVRKPSDVKRHHPSANLTVETRNVTSDANYRGANGIVVGCNDQTGRQQSRPSALVAECDGVRSGGRSRGTPSSNHEATGNKDARRTASRLFEDVLQLSEEEEGDGVGRKRKRDEKASGAGATTSARAAVGRSAPTAGVHDPQAASSPAISSLSLYSPPSSTRKSSLPPPSSTRESSLPPPSSTRKSSLPPPSSIRKSSLPLPALHVSLHFPLPSLHVSLHYPLPALHVSLHYPSQLYTYVFTTPSQLYT